MDSRDSNPLLSNNTVSEPADLSSYSGPPSRRRISLQARLRAADGSGPYRNFQNEGNASETGSLESLNMTTAVSVTSSSSFITEHCHNFGKPSGDSKRARNKLILASVLCLVFMIGEALGGYFAGSLAVLTDAAHLLTDFASFMISLFSIWLASRPPTKRMSFGWHRAEVIGALVSVIMIWFITGILVYEAVIRIRTGVYDIDAKVMLITAGVGVAFNIVMGISLHDAGGHHHHHHHGESHGHGHHHHDHHDHPHSVNASPEHVPPNSPASSVIITNGNTAANGVNVTNGVSKPKNNHHHQTNINVRAAFIHVVGDLFQSVGVLIASYVIYYKPEYRIIDPICTFLFSILVLFTTVKIMQETLIVLMEGMPRGIKFNIVRDTLISIPGVVRIHNLRIWALTMDKIALSAHLAIEPQRSSQDVLKAALAKLKSEFNVHEATIQVEEYSEAMVECDGCQEPKD